MSKHTVSTRTFCLLVMLAFAYSGKILRLIETPDGSPLMMATKAGKKTGQPFAISMDKLTPFVESKYVFNKKSKKGSTYQIHVLGVSYAPAENFIVYLNDSVNEGEIVQGDQFYYLKKNEPLVIYLWAGVISKTPEPSSVEELLSMIPALIESNPSFEADYPEYSFNSVPLMTYQESIPFMEVFRSLNSNQKILPKLKKTDFENTVFENPDTSETEEIIQTQKEELKAKIAKLQDLEMSLKVTIGMDVFDEHRDQLNPLLAEFVRSTQSYINGSRTFFHSLRTSKPAIFQHYMDFVKSISVAENSIFKVIREIYLMDKHISGGTYSTPKDLFEHYVYLKFPGSQLQNSFQHLNDFLAGLDEKFDALAQSLVALDFIDADLERINQGLAPYVRSVVHQVFRIQCQLSSNLAIKIRKFFLEYAKVTKAEIPLESINEKFNPIIDNVRRFYQYYNVFPNFIKDNELKLRDYFELVEEEVKPIPVTESKSKVKSSRRGQNGSRTNRSDRTGNKVHLVI